MPFCCTTLDFVSRDRLFLSWTRKLTNWDTLAPQCSTGVTGAHHSVLFLWSWGSRLRPSNSLTEPLLQSRKEGMYLRLHWRGGKWGKAMFFILAFVLSFSDTSFLDPGVQVQIGKMVSKESRAPN